jgi:hypothetical protein
MSTPRLLPSSGNPPRDEQDYELLRRKVERLQDELADAKLKIQEERNRSAKTLRAQGRLHQELSGLYRALKGVMEELPDEEEIPSVASGGAVPSPRNAAVWNAWKERLGGQAAKVIDALILHGEMNTTQLVIATGVPRSTMPSIIFRLNKASLINKNGRNFSLKEL